MKTFTTKAGAARYAGDRPVLRILNGAGTEDLFVVVDNMRATVHAIDKETGRSDGSISFFDLTVRG